MAQNMITFPQLVEQMASATATAPRVCELFLKELFATISHALINGETVKVKGIGTFSTTAATGGNGETLHRVTFTPDKALAQAVNQPFDQFEPVELAAGITDEMLQDIDRDNPSQLLTQVASNEQDEAQEPPQSTTPAVEKQEPDTVVAEPEVAPPPFETVEQELPQPGDVPVGQPIEQPTEPETDAGRVAEEKNLPSQDVPMGQPIEQSVEPSADDQEPHMATSDSRRKWWLWPVAAALLLGAIVWMCTRGDGTPVTTNPDPVAVVADSDSLAHEAVVQEQPVVVTDTVTRTIVLSTLAQRHYGSPWFWVYIYDANRDKISDPNNVTPGTVVVIPPAQQYGIDANDPQSLKRAQLRSWKILRGR